MTVTVRQRCSREDLLSGLLSGLEILTCRAGRQGSGVSQGGREARLPCNVGTSVLKAPVCQASTVTVLRRKYATGYLGQTGDSDPGASTELQSQTKHVHM